MATNSKIEWTHHTGNLWWGCTKVHAGCDNCYAETLAERYGKNVWGDENPRVAVKSVWADFLKWQAIAQKAGSGFCQSNRNWKELSLRPFFWMALIGLFKAAKAAPKNARSKRFGRT